MPESKKLLEINDLCMEFKSESGKKIKALRNISFDINEGEVFGLVGESGSGKSTIGKCIIGLYKPTSGRIKYNGVEACSNKVGKVFGSGNNIQMIFQDPMSSLNPSMKVKDIVREALDVRHVGSSKEEREKIALEWLSKVGISDKLADRYPEQFSGGQRQRVGIARAMATNPGLIIADECIAALDACVQAQVVNMLNGIKQDSRTAFLFISHDLSMVRFLSDRIGVLHLGYLLEIGTADEIFEEPLHPYTKSLLAAIPKINSVLWDNSVKMYSPASAGINYDNGSWHDVSGTHRVWCTDNELEDWRQDDEK